MALAAEAIPERVNREDYVLGVILHGGFRMQEDGWLYPRGGEPLVRVCVRGNSYFLERRRTLQAVWMQIVSATLDEFEPAAFDHWAASWPLTT